MACHQHYTPPPAADACDDGSVRLPDLTGAVSLQAYM